jgi:hypothetical protein
VGGYLRRLGIAVDDQPGTSGARKGSSAAVPWDTGGGRSVPGAYVCPVDVCARWQYRQPDDDLPTCYLHDRPLAIRARPVSGLLDELGKRFR